MSIAIVDDEEDLVNLFSDALTSSGYDVCSFIHPQLAYNCIKENPKKYSVLITDYRMPDMNGLELAKCTLMLNKKINIIINVELKLFTA